MRSLLRGALGPAAAGFVALVVAACGGTSGGTGGSTPTPTDVGSGTLNGAGSTFVQPFFQKAFYQYQQDHSSVTINYQGVGSGAGIQQFTAGTVDFGATDVPMSSSEIGAAGGASTLVQIPDALGAVAMAYNLPGIQRLQLDGPTLAGIYLGTIKKWNDPAITALNSGVNLPDEAITVVHRSDGSGTSFIFTDYLSHVSTAWVNGPGRGKSVNWPVGVGGKGNPGVAGAIQATAGAIGYVELAYVVQTGMSQAWIKNHDGKYVQASVAGASAAAAQAQSLSADNFSIVDEPGANSDPIVGYTWVVIRSDISESAKAKAIVYLFNWVVTAGQSQGTALQYAPLPKNAQNYAISQLKLIKSGGKAVLS